MKTITMYKLLGLVKDGKAPKKIKYRNEVLYYDEKLKNYFNDEDRFPLFAGVNTILNEKVEILEEEKKIPEKLYKYMEKEEEGCYENILRVYDGGEYEINEDMSFVIDKINEIIDYLKSKGE